MEHAKGEITPEEFEKYRALGQKHLILPFMPRSKAYSPEVFKLYVKEDGCRLTDSTGKVWLDGYAGQSQLQNQFIPSPRRTPDFDPGFAEMTQKDFCKWLRRYKGICKFGYPVRVQYDHAIRSGFRHQTNVHPAFAAKERRTGPLEVTDEDS